METLLTSMNFLSKSSSAISRTLGEKTEPDSYTKNYAIITRESCDHHLTLRYDQTIRERHDLQHLKESSLRCSHLLAFDNNVDFVL